MKTLGILAVAALVFVVPAVAQIAYSDTFSFDTSALAGYTGPFTLDFQLTDGSGSNDGNTSLTVDNFLVDGVGQGIAPVSLTDTSFFSEEMRGFTPGSLLSFDVNGTYGVDSPAPDEFSFGILDGSGAEAPSDSPVGGLLVVDFDNPDPTLVSTAQYRLIGAAAVPEPGALGLLAALVIPIGISRRQSRKS